jgi:tetratricopeptide (TPR) repeat protein
MASTRFQAAHAGCREVGWKKCESHALNGLGGTFYQRAQFAKAEQSYRQSMEISDEIGDRTYSATTLGNIAQVLALLGKPRAGLEASRKVLEEVSLTGQEYLRYVGEYGLGMAYLELGDLERAERHFTNALEASRDNHTTRYEAFSLTRLGELAAYRGDFETASVNLEAALAIQETSKEIATAEVTRAGLAELSLWTGEANRHRKSVEGAVEVLNRTGNRFFAVEAGRVLAVVQLERGEVGPARETIEALKRSAL